MRILHVITSLGIGGAESVAIDLACKHAKSSDVAILTLFKAPDSQRDIAESRRTQAFRNGVTLHEAIIQSRLGILFSVLRLLFRVLWSRPEIVHSHTDLPDFCVSLVRRFVRFNIVRTIHNSELWTTHKWLSLLTESGFTDDLIIAINMVTMDAYKALRRKNGLSPSPFCDIIPNGIDEIGFTEYLDNEKADLLLDGDRTRTQFGFVGRLEKQKGIDVLVEAVDMLPADVIKKSQFHFIGTGALSSMVADLEQRHGDAIRMHGSVPTARTLLRAFDCVLIPSRFEGMPLIGVECLMARVPAVITKIPGLIDIFSDEWPLIANPGDSVSLRDLLVKFILDRTWLPPNISLEAFSLDNSALSYLSNYQLYLGRSK